MQENYNWMLFFVIVLVHVRSSLILGFGECKGLFACPQLSASVSYFETVQHVWTEYFIIQLHHMHIRNRYM